MQQYQASRKQIADQMRAHYKELSGECSDWLSAMPEAIDAWEREPVLLERIARLEARVGALEKALLTIRDWAEHNPDFNIAHWLYSVAYTALSAGNLK